MFGSKKITLRGVASTKLYPEQLDKLDLFNQALVQTVASYKTMDSAVVGESLLQINDMLNFYTFNALESVTMEKTSWIQTDHQKIEDSVLAQDPEFLAIQSETIGSGALREAEYQMTKEFGRKILIDCPDVWSYSVDGRWVNIIDAYEDGNDSNGNRLITVEIGECSPNGPIFYKTLSYGWLGDNVYEIYYTYSGDRDLQPEFILDGPGTAYIIDNSNNYVITPVMVPNDLRVTYILQRDGNTYEVIKGENAFLGVIDKWDFEIQESSKLTASKVRLSIPIVDPVVTPGCNDTYSSEKFCDDPDNVENEEEQETLLETINDPEVKHMFSTYCVDYKEPYIEIIDKLLGTDGYQVVLPNGGIVKWVRQSDHYQDGQWWAYDDGNSYKSMDPLTGFGMQVDDYFMRRYYKDEDTGWTLDEDVKIQYMIPMDWMFYERILPEKYEDVKQCLSYVIYKEKTVKLQFWQRRGFKWVLMGIGFLVFIFTGNPIMLLGSLTAYALDKLDANPIIRAIVDIALAFVTLGTSAFFTIQNMFNMAIKLVTAVTQYYFQSQIESIKLQAKELDENIEETEEAIGEITKPGLYIPLETMDKYYDVATEANTDIFESAYDYDKIYYSDKSLIK